jgi:ribosomal protein S12 methylthiotransferase
VKELIIVSQDTTSYGYDLYGRFALADLLTRLEKIEGIEWLRLMYLYPHLVDRRLAAFFANSKKLISYVDLPIQHGDPTILASMNRGSNDKHIRRAVHLLRSARNDLTIRTTVIVGFPGEKNQHFHNMMQLLEEMAFDRVGVFTYSREDGTPAETLPDHVSDRIKEKRYRKLVNWASQKALEKNQRFVGEIITVLIDRKDPDEEIYWGRYQGQAPEVDGEVMVQGAKLIVGQFAPVRITSADEDNLYGYVNVEIASVIA